VVDRTEPPWRAELEELRGQAVPFVRDHRMRAALRRRANRAERRRAQSWQLIAAFSAGAAIVFALVGWRLGHVAPAAEQAAPAVALHWVGEGCSPGAVVGSACTISAPGLSVYTLAPTEVDVRQASFRMRSGRMRFDVDPASPRERPFVVEVPAGEVQVVGTQFEVFQERATGGVSVSKGLIRFVPRGGGVPSIVSAGDRLTWGLDDGGMWRLHPRVPAVEPSVSRSAVSGAERSGSQSPASDATPKKLRRRATPPPDAEQLVRRVQELREQGDLEAAIRLLSGTWEQPRSARAAQVLSFELGKLLEDAGRIDEACRHWGRHTARFDEDDRYADLVTKARARHGCSNVPTGATGTRRRGR